MNTLEYEVGAEAYKNINLSTVPQKIKILALNQEVIYESDLTKKNYMRMAGITQSYYMFDAN